MLPPPAARGQGRIPSRASALPSADPQAAGLSVLGRLPCSSLCTASGFGGCAVSVKSLELDRFHSAPLGDIIKSKKEKREKKRKDYWALCKVAFPSSKPPAPAQQALAACPAPAASTTAEG